MRKMKKFAAMLLALTMTLGMTMTASAAPSNGSDGKYGTSDDTGVITVSGITAEDNLIVLAHPIVEAKYENSGSFSGYNAIYGADTVTINATTGDITISDEQMTALLAKVDEEKALEMDKISDGTVYTEEVPVGSYLVQIKNAETKIYGNVVVSVKYDRTEAGQTSIEEAVVDVTTNYAAGQPKVQSLPTIDKNIIENKGEENETVKNGNTVDFGETVDYEIKTVIPYYGGAHPVYKIKDSLTGLTLDAAPVVTVGENELVAGTDYTYTATKTEAGTEVGFVLDFVFENEDGTLNYTLNDYQGQTLLVEYSATVNEDAALNAAGNENNATLDFTRDSKVEGNNASVNDKTKSYTFDIDAVGEGALTTNIITKYGQDTTTTTKKLKDAEFTLYTDEECTQKYENTAFGGVVKSDKDGQLTMKGLDEGTYYLKETKAPLGYTINNTVYKITITANIDTNGELTSWEIKVFDTTIKNSEGASSTFTVNAATKKVSKVISETGIQNTKVVSLPSTGGIGTTIFTVAGCGIMIAAAFFFFTGRKKEEN